MVKGGIMELNLINRFIIPDRELLTEEESSRLPKIVISEKLYDGKQREVYLDDFLARLEFNGAEISASGSVSWKSEAVKQKAMSVLQGVNFMRPIVDLYAGLLFGQGIKATSENTEENTWLNGTGGSDTGFVGYLSKKLLQGCTGAGIRGDAVFEIWKDREEEKAQVNVVPAQYWYPITSEKDYTQVVADAVIHQYSLGKEDKKLNRVVVYTKCYNIYFAVETKDNKILQVVNWNSNILGQLPEKVKVTAHEVTEGYKVPIYIEETGLDFNLIQRVPFRCSDNKVFGIPIYTDATISQEKEICIRKTQHSRIIDKYADPVITGPRDLMRKTADDQSVSIRGKYVGLEEGEKIDLVVFSGSLENGRLEMDDCKNNIYRETRTNEAVLGNTKEGIAVLSGTAIEKTMMSTLNEAGVKKMLWSPIISNIIKCAYQLETGKPMSGVVVEFANGLPKSRKEVIEELMLSNGNLPIQSQVSSIMEAYPDMSEADALVEIEKINKEKQDYEGMATVPNNF
jgi:hypothetical protein